MQTVPILSPDAAVYGVIMNDPASVSRLGEAVQQPPYKGLPAAPVLYLKPRNTWASDGAVVRLPAGEHAVEIGAVIGLRMGRDAARLRPESALEAVDACLLAADLSLPHADYYRPAIRQKCFDGSLCMRLLPSRAIGELSSLVLRTWINDVPSDERRLSDLLRAPARLLADVTEFMTLRQGDVLLTGVVYQSPVARTGAHVRVEVPGLARLAFTVETEEESA
ncbi:MAG: fumarylacetoacetate hydrolase family protein [Castellaniella sp.]|jgi:5-oxopent-3-ene-1,2,5-tricarboxylate decarboxylase/2-hydroxyhepta-2,4-diene-1,7-dioate isomerase|uniref:fumarylacetoacetate hydrolase family protein n=1 Tax=Castellaniella sp. TaxID=1955812 RepID=UPI003C791D3B